MPEASLPTYVLVTPARNEEDFIAATMRSVIAQTYRPKRWVVVDDGSTDRTGAIVDELAAPHDWIEVVHVPQRSERHFGAKANAFKAGFERLRAMDFDLVANLDADITLPPDYFAILIPRFTEDSRLGVAGTPYIEDESRPDRHTYAHDGANLEHVSGACQVFRRACFEEIGGYVPIKGGAIDWVAVTTARMKGWRTRTFTDRVSVHHRKIGTGSHNLLMARFHYGRKAYYVGGHPAWEMLRGVNQMRSSPAVIGGMSFIGGYLWAAATRMPRLVPPDLMAFHRQEQMARLKRVLHLA